MHYFSYFLWQLCFPKLVKQKKSKINIGVHEYANWLGKGTLLQEGDRNTNECGGGNIFFCLYLSSGKTGAILKGNEGKSNDGCGDGIEIHCRKGYVDGTIWDKDISITKGTGWQTTGRKGGGSGKGGKGGGGGYRIPIPGVGKGGGGK
ncbi:hypothetical protein MtrunA17_Chr5g0438331 [Medicago truncatula]|uniref:Uncharacterized protein n=1 Tax=Medicago truncatula TaxID=3880 RepID=A0A396I308_MEDTR|nr:eggshell protein 1 isoform X1 [Medicago truncatula]RHN57247.1 hypothetical protein MtrunA17_Chr5g0438331 [Medicago truncatula]